MFYLYALTEENKIKYIGITINPNKRKRDHKLKKPPHTFLILEKNDCADFITEKEKNLIKEYNTLQNGWNISPGGEYRHCSGYKRKGIGGVKKGHIPWNKNKKNCFTKETIELFKKIRKGVRYNTHTKVNEEIVKKIREDFKNHPPIENVGKNSKNGIMLTQERAFANLYHQQYNITSVNLFNIIKYKSWKNVN